MAKTDQSKRSSHPTDKITKGTKETKQQMVNDTKSNNNMSNDNKSNDSKSIDTKPNDTKDQSVQIPTARTIFLKGLDEGITDEEVTSRLSVFGKVSAVRVNRSASHCLPGQGIFCHADMLCTDKEWHRAKSVLNGVMWKGKRLSL